MITFKLYLLIFVVSTKKIYFVHIAVIMIDVNSTDSLTCVRGHNTYTNL